MAKKLDKGQCDLAKKMLIDGETYDSIMARTSLRLKDIKRIQRDEINNHF